MRFFWPNQLNTEPNALTRFGRVIHWIAAAISALIVVIGLGMTVSYWFNGGSLENPIYNASKGVAATFVAALLTYFAGRALRYILSGE